MLFVCSQISQTSAINTRFVPRPTIGHIFSFVLDKWAYKNSVTLDFSRPCKPIDNPFIESLNGLLRDECSNTNWFISLEGPKKRSKPGDKTMPILDRTHHWPMYRQCCLPDSFMNLNSARLSRSDVSSSWEEIKSGLSSYTMVVCHKS